MKILLINNFNEKYPFGGVENYLLQFTKFVNNANTNMELYWYGKDSKKSSWIQKFYNYKTTKEINSIINNFQPDVIHCFSIGAPVTPHFMKYAKKLSIPILYSFRDYYYVCPKNYMLTIKGEIITSHKNGLSCIFKHHPKKNILFDTLLYCKQSYHKRFIKKYVNYFLTPSENLTTTIKNHFTLEGETLPNPLLLKNESQFFTEKEEYLLYVGRLDKEKGVLTLLKAFQNILLNHPNEKLLIVGEGNQMEELIHYKKKHNLKNVIFLGKRDRNQLKEIYSKAKFVIIPSEFLESYCNVVLEAFAFKKTVIISNLLGITKAVEETNSGLVFPFGNMEQLTENIEKLLTNHTLKNELSINGFKMAEARSFENHFNKQIEIYNELLL